VRAQACPAHLRRALFVTCNSTWRPSIVLTAAGGLRQARKRQAESPWARWRRGDERWRWRGGRQPGRDALGWALPRHWPGGQPAPVAFCTSRNHTAGAAPGASAVHPVPAGWRGGVPCAFVRTPCGAAHAWQGLLTAFSGMLFCDQAISGCWESSSGVSFASMNQAA